MEMEKKLQCFDWQQKLEKKTGILYEKVKSNVTELNILRKLCTILKPFFFWYTFFWEKN